jgi:asparagine synthetase B (glutamine-hydrolysing)
MQRIVGRYSLRSQAVSQSDHQIEPQHFITVEGVKLPIRGPFTQAICQRGTAVLYVSQPGEVPLYYSLTPGWVHWHEQKLALPGTAKRINQGEAIIWNPQGCRTEKVDELPLPAIGEPTPVENAIQQYKDLLIKAIARRLPPAIKTVAVSQSGGIDSLMVTWALLRLGIQVVPLTVCTGTTDPDIEVAASVLPQMQAPDPVPILIKPAEVPSLMQEALLCFEDADVGNIKMSIGNLLMARKCRELGIDVIFNGHAQDDMHGVGGLALGNFKKLSGTPSERWRDARRKETHDATGMVKMFASTFRRYSVQVRMPYYDADLLEWTFSQPTTVIPVHHAKPFARAVACSILPPGPWLEPKYNSTGYITGAGFYEDRILITIERSLEEMRPWLRDIKAQGWSAIAALHNLKARTNVLPDPKV